MSTTKNKLVSSILPNTPIFSLKEVLLTQKLLTKEVLDKSVLEADKLHLSLDDYLVTNNLINKKIINESKGEYFNTKYVELAQNTIDQELFFSLPEAFAKKYNCILIKSDQNTLVFASDNPMNEDLLFELKSLFPTNIIKLLYTTKEEIIKELNRYKSKFQLNIVDFNSLSTADLLDKIISEAIHLNSSDIHFEPYEKAVEIRFRVDGILRTVSTLPSETYKLVVNRLKILTKLPIDNHNSAQDGSFRLKGNITLDIRLSIIPVIEGEKIVLRLLYDFVKNLSYTELGISEELNLLLKSEISKPFGMILVSGPTGSGKTTTLYELIKNINSRDINITTIEDPIEYKIEGINQIQVNKATNLTFAKGLKAIVRQDPNVILVGEIRDRETADISVNASLTGHILLSTIHANNAVSSIPRLYDMKIESYLLAASLNFIISQRLVRKICPFCKTSYSTSVDNFEKFFPDAKKYFKSQITLYRGKGCEKCSYQGYLGRTALFEYIKVDESIKKLIIEKSSTDVILQQALKQGFKKMFYDGLDKVKTGITTIDEVLKVSSP